MKKSSKMNCMNLIAGFMVCSVLGVAFSFFNSAVAQEEVKDIFLSDEMEKLNQRIANADKALEVINSQGPACHETAKCLDGTGVFFRTEFSPDQAPELSFACRITGNNKVEWRYFNSDDDEQKRPKISWVEESTELYVRDIQAALKACYFMKNQMKYAKAKRKNK